MAIQAFTTMCSSNQLEVGKNSTSSPAPEILEIIFCLLCHSDLARGRLVCKQWKAVIDTSSSLKMKSLTQIFDSSDWKCYLKPLDNALELSHNIDKILHRPDPLELQKQMWQTHILVLIPSEINDQPLSYPLLEQIMVGSEKCKGFDLSLEFEPFELSVVGVGTESFWLCIRKRKLENEAMSTGTANPVNLRLQSNEGSMNRHRIGLTKVSSARRTKRPRRFIEHKYSNELKRHSFGLVEACLTLFACQVKGDNLDHWIPCRCMLGMKGEPIVINKSDAKLKIFSAQDQQFTIKRAFGGWRISSKPLISHKNESGYSASSSDEVAS